MVVNRKDDDAKDEEDNEYELFDYMENISRKREHYEEFQILCSASADNAIITKVSNIIASVLEGRELPLQCSTSTGRESGLNF